MDAAKPSLFSTLRGLVWRHGVSALGVIGVVLSIYFFWYQEFGKAGEVAISLRGEGNVLTVQRQVPDLDIMYRGSSLLGSSKSLRFYSVQITNSGSVHILKPYFDDQVIWGFQLKGAEILQISNSEYSVGALENTKPSVAPPDSIRLIPVNLDIGDWIRIDFLALIDKDVEPTLRPTGRISGTRLVMHNELPGSDGGFLQRAFSGSVFVQAVRAPTYTLLFMLTLAASISAVAFTASLPEQHRERRRAKKLLSIESDISVDASEEQRSLVRRINRSDGAAGLERLRKIIGTEEGRAEVANARKTMERLKKEYPDLDLRQARLIDRRDMHGEAYNDFASWAVTSILDNEGNVDETKAARTVEYVEAVITALKSNK